MSIDDDVPPSSLDGGDFSASFKEVYILLLYESGQARRPS
jgi:hypothetical protein